MSDDAAAGRYRPGTVFSLGVSVGLVIGLAVGSVVAMRLGADAVDTMRGLIDRMSGRGNQVNFELLLQ